MDSWYFGMQIVGHVRKWLAGEDGDWARYYFYPDSRHSPVDVPAGKRVRVEFLIEDDPDYDARISAMKGTVTSD